VFNFLNPLFLFALAAAAIPFLIHFLNRFRARRQEFSSLMLLKEIQHRRMRKLKMRQWLLLALRTLIIILFVLIPARPVVKGFFRSGPADHLPTSAVFILDISASLGYVGREGSAFEFLLQQLKQISGWLNPGDRCRLITADEGCRAVGEHWSRKTGNNTLAPEMPHPQQPGNRATSLAPALTAAAELLESETSAVAREVYLFSDRQQRFLGADSLSLNPESGIRWYLIEPHRAEPENLSLASLSMPGELLRPGVPLKLTIEVAHYGGVRDIQCLPRVYLDGRLVAQGEAMVPPNETSPVVVELPALEAGYHELAAVLDADALQADNRRTTVINVPSRARVLFVEKRRSASDYLGTALEVLAAGVSSPITLSRRNSLPLAAAELERADLIILHGLDFPAAAQQTFWRQAASRGANVLVIPAGADTGEEEILKNFNAAVSRLGLPLSLGPPLSSGQGAYDTPISQPGAAAPAGSVFSPLFEAIGGLERIKVFAQRSLPGAENFTAAALSGPEAAPGLWDMPLAGGGILIRLLSTSRLRAAVAAADLSDPLECELPETPLFVPFLHALITLITGNEPLISGGHLVGETVDIYFGNQVNTREMEIHGPGNSRFRLPPGEISRFAFSRTDLPGTYRIYDGQKLIGAFSVGLRPRESDLRLEDRDKLQSLFGEAGLRIVGPADELAEAVFLERGGVEAWPALIILALVLLIAEQVVANNRKTGS